MARVSLSLLAMLLVWWWVAMVRAEYLKYKDPQQPVGVRVGDLLGRMTLEEKIGQMVQIDRSVANVNTLKTYSIGNLYFYTHTYIHMGFKYNLQLLLNFDAHQYYIRITCSIFSVCIVYEISVLSICNYAFESWTPNSILLY